MNHLKVKQLNYLVELLINYCVEKKITNLTLNYALKKNQRILGEAVKSIDDSVSQELKDLEKKAFDLGGDKIKTTVEAEKDLAEEQKTKFENQFSTGFELLTDEEKARHKELADEFNEFMKEENDTQLYMIDFAKIEDIPIEYQYLDILENFIR